MLGTAKVNRSTFVDFRNGVETEMRGSAQVDVNFNSFDRDTVFGPISLDIFISDSRQSTTIIGNTFSGFSATDISDGTIFGNLILGTGR